jgi:PKD repeat protein
VVKQQWDTIPAQLDSTGQYTYADIWDNLGMHECVANLTADFSAGDTLICEGGIVNFAIEETAYTIESVSWEFPGGNPSSSNELEPAVEYALAGDYDVTLVVFTNSGSSTTAKQNYIHVNSMPAIPDKPMGDTLVCFNADFSDYTTNTTSSIWDLSPSSAGTLNYYDSTCHIIWNQSFTGQSSLKVMASNNCGNSEFSEVLTINKTDSPLISFTEDITVCFGDSKLLEPQVSGGTPPFIYNWEPAGLFDDPGSHTPVVTPIATTNIYLYITDDYGCTKTEEFLVTVEGEDYNIAFTAFPLQFSAPPFNVQFDNQTPNQDNFDYIWYFGNGDSSLLAQPNYTYSGNGLYSVSLIAISKQTGCSDTLVNEDLITCTGASGIGDYDAMNFSYWVNQEEKILGLSFKSQPQNLLFQLFDLYGKEHFSSSIHQKEYSVALQELAPGMYFFVIDSKITGKILIL